MGDCYFAGGNSGEGFFDCFDQLMETEAKRERIIYLKGGPGVGKSTLMKKVLRAAEEKQERTECFYCSGDPDSLDAVRLVERGILVMDATAPHCKDPDYPGAVEEILNLGEQIDREKLQSRRREIIRLVEENREHYRRAYALLRSAAALQRELQREAAQCLDKTEVARLRSRLLEGSAGSGVTYGTRRLFADAITWKGEVSLAGTLGRERSCICFPGPYAGVLLHAVAEGGFLEPVTRLLHPLAPELTAHLLLQRSRLLLTGEILSDGRLEETEHYFAKKPQEELLRYEKEKERLTRLAVKCLKQCKKLHDELEECYHACVDFEKISERSDILLNQLSL